MFKGTFNYGDFLMNNAQLGIDDYAFNFLDGIKSEINLISANIIRSGLIGGPTKIIIPMTFKELFKRCHYLKFEVLRGCGEPIPDALHYRFEEIEFNENLIDEIKVIRGFLKTEIKEVNGVRCILQPYTPTDTQHEPGDMTEVCFKYIPVNKNKEIVNRIISSSRGVLKIDNFKEINELYRKLYDKPLNITLDKL
jgi:hypothetical protein